MTEIAASEDAHSSPASPLQSWILGASAALLLFFAALALWGLMPFYRATVTGDIPHYVLAAQSLIEDGDFDLANNYGDPSSYASWFHETLSPMYAPGTTRPYRSVGLPLLLAPGWLLAELVGALSLSALAICAGAGLLGALMFRETGSVALGLAMAVLAVFNIPTVAYLFYPYPDVFSGLVHLGLFLILTRRLPGATRPLRWVALTVALHMLLVWIHFKFLLLGPVLVALIAATAPRGRRLVLGGGAAAAMIVNVAAYVLYHWAMGVDLAAYRGDARLSPWPQAVFGLLFDRQFGVFYYFPLLALPMAEMLRQLLVGPRREVLIALALLIPLYLMHGLFWGWWGGWAPCGRHMLNVLPLMLYFFIPFAKTHLRRPRFAVSLVCGLLALGFAVHMVVALDQNLLHRLMNIHPRLVPPPTPLDLALYDFWGEAHLFNEYHINEYLPSLIFIDGRGLRTLVLTMTALLAFTLWHGWPEIRGRAWARPRALALLALAWFALCGALYWDLRTRHSQSKVRVAIENWGHPPAHFRHLQEQQRPN